MGGIVAVSLPGGPVRPERPDSDVVVGAGLPGRSTAALAAAATVVVLGFVVVTVRLPVTVALVVVLTEVLGY
jgi:hypothetical protein